MNTIESTHTSYISVRSAADRKKIVVIGAGVGGLGVALRLAHRGHDVTVFEKNDFVGGRCSGLTVGEASFDGGPTLLMMLDPFRKLFSDVGERLEDHLDITLCDPTYRVFYADGTLLDSTSDQPTMTNRIAAMSGAAEAAKFGPFMTELKSLFEESIPNFVRKNYRRLSDFAAPDQLRRVLKHHMLGNLAKRVNQRFADPRLQQLFSFQAMYLGLSPYDAPWVYATLAYMEYGEGIWYPKGGLKEIPNAIARLAEQRGVTIRLGTDVAAISKSGIALRNGEVVRADVIIANSDMPYAQRELQRQPTRRKLRYSCSAYMLYIDYDGLLPGLEHHNVFFGGEFEKNLRSLFHELKYPDDPAFYVCVSSRTEESMAAPGRSNVMILVPIPNLEFTPSAEDTARLEEQVFRRLLTDVGFDQAKIVEIRRRTAADWSGEFNLDRGAAFGISHDLFQSAFMRPQNHSKDNPNLYYVGASTVPGNGLPMVLISAELVERRLVDEGVLS